MVSDNYSGVAVDSGDRGHRPLGRIHQLDVLRGLAILLVVIAHGSLLLQDSVQAPPVLKQLMRFGWTGVDLFFVLSGFLIGTLLFHEIRRTGRLSISRFLYRRAWKILPAYFVLLGFEFFRAHLGNRSWQVTFAEYWPNLLQVQNYRLTPLTLTWSLAAEEHFYLLLPACIWLTFKYSKPRSLPLTFVVLMILILGYRCFRNWLHPHAFSLQGDYTPTHLRIDSLLCGVLLAFANVFHHNAFVEYSRRLQWPMLLIGSLLVCPMLFLPQTSRLVYTIGYTWLYLGYGAIMISLLSFSHLENSVLSQILWSRPILAVAWVGQYSYSIYLWHFDLGLYPVAGNHFRYYIRAMSINSQYEVSFLVFITLAIFAGVLMTWIVERPMLALRDRFAPNAAGQPVRSIA